MGLECEGIDQITVTSGTAQWHIFVNSEASFAVKGGGFLTCDNQLLEKGCASSSIISFMTGSFMVK